MKKELIVTGKTIDEAMANAAEQLGEKMSENIEYEILEFPKKGILGIGSSPAKIKVIYTIPDEDPALELVNMLIRSIGLKATAVASNGAEGEHKIEITGEDAGVLIGHHGETLDALQYIANLAANRRAPVDEDGTKKQYTKVTIDVENYRKKREETLRALARRMAARVLKYKRSITLEPMNPYERRIIHSEIQGIDGVSTHSIGVDNDRKIVITLDRGDKPAV